MIKNNDASNCIRLLASFVNSIASIKKIQITTCTKIIFNISLLNYCELAKKLISILRAILLVL